MIAGIAGRSRGWRAWVTRGIVCLFALAALCGAAAAPAHAETVTATVTVGSNPVAVAASALANLPGKSRGEM